MSDSEEYSSGEDEDYLPSGEDYSEDDVSELVKEDEAEEEEENPAKCKKNAKGLTCRNRSKKGGLLGKDGRKPPKVDDSEDSDSGESHNTPLKENERREKEEALWASFLSDVGQKPKAAATGEASCTQEGKPAEEENSCKLQESRTEPGQSKVAITQVFDFAGEEVRVTKEVDAASKEAQLFLKQQEQRPADPASHPTVSGVKRPSGMNHLLGKITAKKQKLSTLEKSKLDWESFKEEEGIGDELAVHNRGKDGYLERQAFLERVDHRQFERERDIRLSTMKP